MIKGEYCAFWSTSTHTLHSKSIFLPPPRFSSLPISFHISSILFSFFPSTLPLSLLFSSLFLFALCCYGNESQFPPRTMPVTVPTEMQDNAIGCFFFPSRLKSVTRVCTSPTLELTSSVDTRWDTSSGQLTECWTNTPSHQLWYQNNSISSPVVRGAPGFLTSTLYNVAKLLTAWTHTQHRRFVMFIPHCPFECYE